MTTILFKTDPKEIINVGDIIMLDVKTGLVTVSKAESEEDYQINNTLIVGICTESDNVTLLPILIDCGNSATKDKDVIIYNLGDSTTETNNVLEGGTSKVNPREFIKTINSGIVTLTHDHRHIEIGDKVVMSIEPNKVTSNMFDDFDRREWIYARPLGKVVQILEDNKVKVLLDIE